MATETIDEFGKRLRWQCGCRQNGGVVVNQWKPGDPDIDELIEAARAVVYAAEDKTLQGFNFSPIRNEVIRLRRLVDGD